MNHQTVADEQLIDRYLQGKLTPELEASFETHYLSCQECLDQLALAESMGRGFKQVAREEVHHQSAVRQLFLLTWLARLGRSRQMAALMVAGLTIALLPSLWAIRERDRRVEERGRQAEVLRRLEVESGKLGEELAESRAEISRQQQARAVAEGQLALARVPQGNVPILFLGTERGAGEPSHRVRLPAQESPIVLALEIEAPHQPRYRVRLRDAAGQELWRGDELEINQMETLALSIPSSLLTPGDHLLTAEGLGTNGRVVATARFSFRVLPRQ